MYNFFFKIPLDGANNMKVNFNYVCVRNTHTRHASLWLNQNPIFAHHKTPAQNRKKFVKLKLKTYLHDESVFLLLDKGNTVMCWAYDKLLYILELLLCEDCDHAR